MNQKSQIIINRTGESILDNGILVQFFIQTIKNQIIFSLIFRVHQFTRTVYTYSQMA